MSREIRSPVYQIDFTAVDAGKRIATSKRRIRWRFGFTNQDALASGETGTACRGEEHDITLIWSLTSGKRLVLADGQEVHYSNSRSQVFDFSWTMRGNHVLKVVAHATTPMNAHPNFRQYDFFVDGMSFFSMPKVYRLGLTGAEPVQDMGTLALAHSSRRSAYGNYSVGGGSYGGPHSVSTPRNNGPSSIVEIEAPHNEQEEEAYLREAIKASLSEQENEKARQVASASFGAPTPAPKEEDDLLIDFMSEPGPAPAPAPVATNAFAMVPAQAPPAAGYAQPPPPPPPVAGFAQPPPPTMPVQAVSDPFAAPQMPPPPVPTPVFNQPFAAPPVPPPAPPVAGSVTTASVATMPEPSIGHPPPPVAPGSVSQPVAAPSPTPTPTLTPAQAPILTMAPQSTGLGSDANAAYAKFASMDQFDLVKPKAEARSNPFDDPVPAAPTGGGGTLADMKAKAQINGDKKEIMKNTMVVAQQQGGNWSSGVGAPGGYNNYGMQIGGAAAVPVQAQGHYGMQPPMQQRQFSQYGGFGQQQQPGQAPLANGNMYGGQTQQYPQQFQQQQSPPHQGFGQSQQPF